MIVYSSHAPTDTSERIMHLGAPKGLLPSGCTLPSQDLLNRVMQRYISLPSVQILTYMINAQFTAHIKETSKLESAETQSCIL